MLSDAGWWQTPLWQYAVYAVVYSRVAAERLAVPVGEIARRIAARTATGWRSCRGWRPSTPSRWAPTPAGGAAVAGRRRSRPAHGLLHGARATPPSPVRRFHGSVRMPTAHVVEVLAVVRAVGHDGQARWRLRRRQGAAASLRLVIVEDGIMP